MRDIEYKVIRFLIFIAILFLNYHVMMLFTSFIAPEGFLNDVKRIGGFYKSSWATCSVCIWYFFLFKNVPKYKSKILSSRFVCFYTSGLFVF